MPPQQPPRGAEAGRRAPRPLEPASLEALALRHVGRYATTRARLLAYLRRKLGERGWAGAAAAAPEALVERLAGLGYVDDRAFAAARGAALSRRGFGGRRVDAALRAAGISADDGADASRDAREEGWKAALALARRRRIGPFAPVPPDREARERAIAILVRAGHDFALARRIAGLNADDPVDLYDET